MYDVLIIGGGPAGVSTALYTARAGLKTAIVYKGAGALSKAERIENFYGQAQPLPGGQIMENGLEQARALGVETILEEVTELTLEENFLVNRYEAKTVALATGASRSAPDVPGLKDFEGRGVSYCAVCDAFFYRGRDVAVLGSGAFALHEAEVLLPLVKSVTLVTNGEPVTERIPESIKIIPEPLDEIGGEKFLEYLRFKNGEEISVSGLFVAVGVAGGTDLARKIGAVIENNNVAADRSLRTSVPGLWAAGDCVAGLKQIAKAVYDGAVAGMDIAKYLRQEKRDA